MPATPLRYLLLALAYHACRAERPRPGIVLLYSKSVATFDARDAAADSLDARIVNEAEAARGGRRLQQPGGGGGGGGGPKPKCARETQYCLYDEDYPMDKVSEILDTYRDEVHRTYHAMHAQPLRDIVLHDNRTHGYRHKGSFVCESEVAYVRPGWARNWRDEWVAVVNTDKYPQSMRVETCKYEGMKCEYLPPCYKSFCVQRSTFVQLLCVDPFNVHRRPVVDLFEVPSACSCFVENFTYY